MKNKAINIGCGYVYDPSWVNVDLNPINKSILKIDLRKKLPFEDGSFKYAYSSHVLEHLTTVEAENLIDEVYRIMKPGGVFRILVPDLETICMEYLKNLKKAYNQGKYLCDYQWIKLEMFDQITREKTGGEMLNFLSQKDIPNKDYVLNRIGLEAKKYFYNGKKNKRNEFSDYLVYLKGKKAEWYFDKIRYVFLAVFVYIFGGRSYLNSFRSGVFRNSGEIHRQMYDRLSLSLLLKSCGFRQVNIVDPFKSQIPGFSKFKLDVVNGEVRKPDSIFIEATK
jgi:predicted SAM-dependent methyltransferase